MPTQLPETVTRFIDALNRSDLNSLMDSVADSALISDKHRSFWGKEAIRRWSEVEIIGDRLRLEVRDVAEHYGDYIVTAKIDGQFDKAKFDLFVTNSSITVRHGIRPEVLLFFFFTLQDNRIGQLIITPIDGASPIKTDPTPYYIPNP